MDKFIYLIF